MKRHFAVGGDFATFDIGRPFFERSNACRIGAWRDSYLFADKFLVEQAETAKFPLRPVCPYVSSQSSKEPICTTAFAPGRRVVISFQRQHVLHAQAWFKRRDDASITTSRRTACRWMRGMALVVEFSRPFQICAASPVSDVHKIWCCHCRSVGSLLSGGHEMSDNTRGRSYFVRADQCKETCARAVRLAAKRS